MASLRRSHACALVPRTALLPHMLEHLQPTSTSDRRACVPIPLQEPFRLALLVRPAPDPLEAAVEV